MNLVEGLINGIEKCRRLQAQCAEIGAPGGFLLMMLEASIESATLAMANNDVVGMVQAAKDIAGYTE